jgi:hypothetical protein
MGYDATAGNNYHLEGYPIDLTRSTVNVQTTSDGTAKFIFERMRDINTVNIIQADTVQWYRETSWATPDIYPPTTTQIINNFNVTSLRRLQIEKSLPADVYQFETFNWRGGTAEVPAYLSTINILGQASSGYHYLSIASGVVIVNYTHISGSHVSGGATWYCIDGWDDGGNQGWIFLNARRTLPFVPEGIPLLTGVYTLGSYSSQYPQVLDFTYPISQRILGEFLLTGVEIGSIIVEGNDIFVAWKSNYIDPDNPDDPSIQIHGVDKVDYDYQLDGAYFETRLLTGNREQFGNFVDLVISYAHMSQFGSIVIEYSTNYGETWITVETVDDIQRQILSMKPGEIESTTLLVRVTVHSATYNNAPDIERLDIVMR